MKSTNNFRNIPGIYKITNKINGKCYIGQSTKIKNRIAVHRRACRNLVVSNAILKYGVENFEFEVLIYCETNMLDYYEKLLIVKYSSTAPNGYNIAEGGHERRIVSESTKNKQSEKMKDRYSCELNPFYGKRHTIETKNKISDIHKGKVISDEHRKIISDSNKARTGEKSTWFGKEPPFKGRTHNESSKKMIGDAERGERNHMSIPVSIKGVNYSCYSEAAVALGIPTTTLRYRVKSTKDKYSEYIKIDKSKGE